MNRWVDISEGDIVQPHDPYKQVRPLDGFGSLFWFDERDGRLFIRYRYLLPRFNAICVSYRYGSEEEPPAMIKRACNLMVAQKILAMDFYSVKVGMGGDISGLRDQAFQRWDDEINKAISAYQRAGSIHSLYR